MPPALPDSRVGRASGPARVAVPLRSTYPEYPEKARQERARKEKAANALETLLADLGPQIKRGPATSSFFEEGEAFFQEAGADRSRYCATGIEALDLRLGGGFPRGRLSEICGPPSSGRTALAQSLLATTLAAGGLTGWIDFADAFDPISAAKIGIDLERLLWVRPRSEKEALQSCDRLLQTEGFELVIFDCVNTPVVHDVAWLRLARLAARSRTALVALSETKASARPDLVLEMRPLAPHFTDSPSLFDSLETTAVVMRHRTRPAGSEVLLHLHEPPP